LTSGDGFVDLPAGIPENRPGLGFEDSGVAMWAPGQRPGLESMRRNADQDRPPARGGRAPGLRAAVWLLLLLAVSGCASDQPVRAIQPEFDLHDPDPRIRMRAVEAVAGKRDAQYVPDLIEMLDDEDEAVRVVAIGALRDLTGHDTGYVAYASPRELQDQVRAWRAWHAGGGAAAPAGAPAGGGGP
jgi:hypothetical protein